MRAAITPLGGISNDQLAWQEQGRWEGRNEGIDIGRRQGLTEGYNEGYDNGYSQGFSAGTIEGNTAGYNEAIDEANAAIERLQAQHATYQLHTEERYQVYESERDKLKQLAFDQAAEIQVLREQLDRREHAARQHQANIDNLLAANQRLKQENEAIQKETLILAPRVNSLLLEKAELSEIVENITLAKDANRLKFHEQLAHYNKTLTALNAILGAVKSTLGLNPAIKDSFSKLFADEYKKSVEFRTQVDDIKSAPHEDSDFALLLPQTHEFILTMLESECCNKLSKK